MRVWLVARYIKWLTTNFVITSDRVIFRHGVFAKSGIEIPLERVNSVHFNQGIIERLLGAGDLLIESGAEEGGSGSPTSATRPGAEPDPLADGEERGPHVRRTGSRGGARSTSPTQLEKLEGMRDRGSLTHEEFETQKRKLLG